MGWGGIGELGAWMWRAGVFGGFGRRERWNSPAVLLPPPVLPRFPYVPLLSIGVCPCPRIAWMVREGDSQMKLTKDYTRVDFFTVRARATFIAWFAFILEYQYYNIGVS